MKVALALSAVAALAGNASAFYGQMAASAYEFSAQLGNGQEITLTDYNTGSTYWGWLPGGFNGCVSSQCNIL
jgi:hypothetical protein